MTETFVTVFGSPELFLWIIVGVFWGMFIGFLPGIGSSLAMAVALPVLAGFALEQTIVVLISIYTSAVFGASISAILLNIPGMGGNLVTTFDGYPMTQQGKAGEALGAAAMSSFIGTVLACGLLLVVGPSYVKFVLRFGPHELFVVALWGLCISIACAPGSLIKKSFAACLGFILACIGIDILYGVPRLTFGSDRLLIGVTMIPALIGIFGVYAVLKLAAGEKDLMTAVKQKTPKLTILRVLRRGWTWVIMMISTVLGFVIGVIPGTGAIVASFISYGIFRKVSPKREEYGKGCVEGVVAPETANNAVRPGATLTTLILGIPGAVEMVVILAAFNIYGLPCGPTLLLYHPEILEIIFISFMLAGFFALVATWTTIWGWTKVIETPAAYLWPIILLLCIVGTYSIHNNPTDVLVAIGFGLLAFFGERNGFSRIPLVMGMALGPIIEAQLRSALLLEPPQAFFAKPIAVTLFILLIVMFYVFERVLTTRKIVEKGGVRG